MSSVLGVTPSKQSQFDRQLRRRHKSVNFRLTSKPSPISSSTIKADLTGHMKKTFALSALIPLALICSCQKQDSTAEQQLTQRKTELDAREKALDEREKALEEREKLVAKSRVPSVPRIAPTPGEPQRTVPPELQGLMADPSQLRAEREQRMQERLAERQRKLEEVQRRRVRAVPPNQTTAPSTEQAVSPSPSPTPE
jgi:hypothetical protein